MEPEGLIPNSQELSTCSYPELHQSSLLNPIAPFQDPILRMLDNKMLKMFLGAWEDEPKRENKNTYYGTSQLLFFICIIPRKIKFTNISQSRIALVRNVNIKLFM
jgi:hypothetical protein